MEAYADRPGQAAESRLRFRVLSVESAADLEEWRRAWAAWPGREVMAHPDYVRLFARPCDRAVCVVGEEPAGAVLFPLILRPLATEPWSRPSDRRWDATSPYGYGGPFAQGARSEDDALFWQAYLQWCEQESIVSTVARLSPFFEQLASIPGPVEECGRNVVVALEANAGSLWRSYETKVRKWVRTAEQAGVEVEMDSEGARLDEFCAVYSHTMQRNGAAEWYYFSPPFFKSIVENLRGSYVFFHALYRGKVVSSDLVLHSAKHAYFFLSGTLADAFELGPNYLLKHRALAWAAGAGKTAFVLGGGWKPDDGLLRYKRAFARHGEVPFKVACLTHSEGECRSLSSDRAAYEVRQSRIWAPRPGFFPPYRA